MYHAWRLCVVYAGVIHARRLEIVVEHVGILLYHAWRLCVVHTVVVYVRKLEFGVVHARRLL